jgi:hypothetical protein
MLVLPSLCALSRELTLERFYETVIRNRETLHSLQKVQYEGTEWCVENCLAELFGGGGAMKMEDADAKACHATGWRPLSISEYLVSSIQSTGHPSDIHRFTHSFSYEISGLT